MANGYQDKGWLEKKYNTEKLSCPEIADIAGVSATTIQYWMDKHDIDRRDLSNSAKVRAGTNDKPYNDKEWLEKKYLDEKMSTVEIADLVDVHHTTINNSLDKFDIDRRGYSESVELADIEYPTQSDHHNYKNYLPVKHDNGYLYWVDNTNHNWIAVHRLAAVAWFGLDKVKDKVVHHKNGIKYDNREENLDLMTQSEHVKKHRNKQDEW